MAERLAAHADRDPGRLRALHVDVAGRGVAGLVQSDRPRVLLGILDVDGGPGLDRRHGLEDVGGVESLAAVCMRIGQRHRADLLDHRRRVAASDAGELVALLLGVELPLVVDLADVEVEDVLAVGLRGRPQPDVPPHAPRARERGIELADGDVRGADEIDLVLPRLRPRNTQREAAHPRGDDVGRVEERVRPVREQAAEEGRVVDPVHDDEELVQRELAAAHHPRDGAALAEDLRQAGRLRRLALALREQPVAPRARLENHVAARVQRSPRPVEERVVDSAARVGGRRAAERLPPHPDCVDLVDEDDALPAPFPGQLLRLAREPAHDHGVHPEERLLESRAGHQHEGAVEARRDRLGEHRLSGSGLAEEEQPALALSSGRFERLAALPERDDAADFLLGLVLAAHVLEAHAPVRIAGLEAAHLRDSDQHHRAEEDEGVEEEEEREAEEEADQLLAANEGVDRVVDGRRAADPARRSSGKQQADDPDDRQDDDQEDDELEDGAPERDAAARDDVLLLERVVVGAVEARPGQQATGREVDRAAESDHDQERRGQRPAEAPAEDRVEPDERRGARDHRDRGRAFRQVAPALPELRGGRRTVEEPGLHAFGRHT